MTRSRIRVPVKFDEWIEGLENLDASDEVLREWDRATERFYGHSQETVHVITNALRTTGRYHTERDGHNRVLGDVIYGGQTVSVPGYKRDRVVDYAIYEHQRGHDHAWLTVAFAQSRDDYERALLDGIDAAVGRFL
jgi:hypothetical protein